MGTITCMLCESVGAMGALWGKKWQKKSYCGWKHWPNLMRFSFIGKHLNLANSAPMVYLAGLFIVLCDYIRQHHWLL